MKRWRVLALCFGAVLILSALGLDGVATATGPPIQLNVRTGHGNAHLMLTRALSAQNAPYVSTGPLVYNGGPVMVTYRAYLIFWEPPTLQDGTPGTVASNYNSLLQRYFKDVGGHSLYTIQTQYYQSGKKYIQNNGKLGGVYVDTSSYPTGQCSDPYTGSNCVSDANIISEISKVMGLKGWKGGLTNQFFVYTDPGEGTCVSPGSCSFSVFCAYHSYFPSGSTYVIYANMAYYHPNCDAGVPKPNNSAADTVMSISSHEQFEAITDPLLNAWFDSSGLSGENADKCNFNYGSPTWAGGLANQEWNGHDYELQQEWDNHAFAIGSPGCQQVGPA